MLNKNINFMLKGIKGWQFHFQINELTLTTSSKPSRSSNYVLQTRLTCQMTVTAIALSLVDIMSRSITIYWSTINPITIWLRYLDWAVIVHINVTNQFMHDSLVYKNTKQANWQVKTECPKKTEILRIHRNRKLGTCTMKKALKKFQFNF